MWVVQEGDAVIVRLLLVFPSGALAKGPSLETLVNLSFSQLGMDYSIHEQIHAGVPQRISQQRRSVLPSCRIRMSQWAQHRPARGKPYIAFCIEAIQPGPILSNLAGDSTACGVWRRYSQFAELRDRIGFGPSAPFPGKCIIRSALCGLSSDQLEDRRCKLQAWLQQLVTAALRNFLQQELWPELCSFIGAW